MSSLDMRHIWCYCYILLGNFSNYNISAASGSAHMFADAASNLQVTTHLFVHICSHFCTSFKGWALFPLLCLFRNVQGSFCWRHYLEPNLRPRFIKECSYIFVIAVRMELFLLDSRYNVMGSSTLGLFKYAFFPIVHDNMWPLSRDL